MKYFAKLAVVAALCIAPCASFAGGTSVGIKGGVVLAGFTGSEADAYDSKISGCGYLFLNTPLNNSLSLNIEAGFVDKGASFDGTFYYYDGYSYISGDVTFQDNLRYIELPVLLKYTIENTSSIAPFIYAGPSFNFLVSSTMSGDLTGDITGLNAFDLGLTAGAGIDVPMGSNSLVFDVRYSLGLTNISSSDKIENSTVAIMVGIGFGTSGGSHSHSSGGSQNLIQ